MKVLIVTLTCLSALAAPLSSQSVLLHEEFDSALFPPSGWEHWNQGSTPGWDWEPSGRARHLDWFGLSDADLVTPLLDSTGFSQLSLHAIHGQLFSTYREINEVRVTLDGGISSNLVHQVSQPQDGPNFPLELDLSAYAGIAGFQVMFHYQGDFANEWTLDRVTIDNLPPLIPPYWPELPTQFDEAEGYRMRFDELLGVVPASMGINSVDEFSRKPDLEGWCNVGQLAPSLFAYSGSTCLELGLHPHAATFHDVSNALVIGLNGSSLVQPALEFQVYQLNEEWNADDGVFLSQDGITWHPLRTDWVLQTGGTAYAESWRKLSFFMDTTPVSLDGNFFLAFAQADDFPYGSNDGVAIDDVRIGSSVQPLQVTVSNLIGGQTAEVLVEGADPARVVTILYSFDGAGPTLTPYGLAQVSAPTVTLVTRDPDLNGMVRLQVAVPVAAIGRAVWAQAIEFLGVDGRFSNPLTLEVQ